MAERSLTAADITDPTISAELKADIVDLFTNTKDVKDIHLQSDAAGSYDDAKTAFNTLLTSNLTRDDIEGAVAIPPAGAVAAVPGKGIKKMAQDKQLYWASNFLPPLAKPVTLDAKRDAERISLIANHIYARVQYHRLLTLATPSEKIIFKNPEFKKELLEHLLKKDAPQDLKGFHNVLSKENSDLKEVQNAFLGLGGVVVWGGAGKWMTAASVTVSKLRGEARHATLNSIPTLAQLPTLRSILDQDTANGVKAKLSEHFQNGPLPDFKAHLTALRNNIATAADLTTIKKLLSRTFLGDDTGLDAALQTSFPAGLTPAQVTTLRGEAQLSKFLEDNSAMLALPQNAAIKTVLDDVTYRNLLIQHWGTFGNNPPANLNALIGRLQSALDANAAMAAFQNQLGIAPPPALITPARFNDLLGESRLANLLESNKNLLAFFPELQRILKVHEVQEILIRYWGNNQNATIPTNLLGLTSQLASLPHPGGALAARNALMDALIPIASPSGGMPRGFLDLELKKTGANDAQLLNDTQENSLRGQAKYAQFMMLPAQQNLFTSFPSLKDTLEQKPLILGLGHKLGNVPPLAFLPGTPNPPAPAATAAAAASLDNFRDRLANLEIKSADNDIRRTFINNDAFTVPNANDADDIDDALIFANVDLNNGSNYLVLMAKLSKHGPQALIDALSKSEIKAALTKYWVGPPKSDLDPNVISEIIKQLQSSNRDAKSIREAIAVGLTSPRATAQLQTLYDDLHKALANQSDLKGDGITPASTAIFSQIQYDRLLKEAKADSDKGIRQTLYGQLIASKNELLAALKIESTPQGAQEYLKGLQSNNAKKLESTLASLGLVNPGLKTQFLNENQVEFERLQWLNKIENSTLRNIYIKAGSILENFPGTLTTLQSSTINNAINDLNKELRTLTNSDNNAFAAAVASFYNALIGIPGNLMPIPRNSITNVSPITAANLAEAQNSQKNVNKLHMLLSQTAGVDEKNPDAKPPVNPGTVAAQATNWNEELRKALIKNNVTLKTPTPGYSDPDMQAVREFNYASGKYDELKAAIQKIAPGHTGEFLSNEDFNIIQAKYTLVHELKNDSAAVKKLMTKIENIDKHLGKGTADLERVAKVFEYDLAQVERDSLQAPHVRQRFTVNKLLVDNTYKEIKATHDEAKGILDLFNRFIVFKPPADINTPDITDKNIDWAASRTKANSIGAEGDIFYKMAFEGRHKVKGSGFDESAYITLFNKLKQKEQQLKQSELLTKTQVDQLEKAIQTAELEIAKPADQREITAFTETSKNEPLAGRTVDTAKNDFFNTVFNTPAPAGAGAGAGAHIAGTSGVGVPTNLTKVKNISSTSIKTNSIKIGTVVAAAWTENVAKDGKGVESDLRFNPNKDLTAIFAKVIEANNEFKSCFNFSAAAAVNRGLQTEELKQLFQRFYDFLQRTYPNGEDRKISKDTLSEFLKDEQKAGNINESMSTWALSARSKTANEIAEKLMEAYESQLTIEYNKGGVWLGDTCRMLSNERFEVLAKLILSQVTIAKTEKGSSYDPTNPAHKVSFTMTDAPTEQDVKDAAVLCKLMGVNLINKTLWTGVDVSPSKKIIGLYAERLVELAKNSNPNDQHSLKNLLQTTVTGLIIPIFKHTESPASMQKNEQIKRDVMQNLNKLRGPGS